MKKCLLYGTEQFYKQLEAYIDIIAYYEELKQFDVVGYVSTDPEPVQWGKYHLLPYSCLLKDNYDIIIVMIPKDLFAVCKSALVNMGVSQEIIIPCVALTFAGFDVEKYLSILHNPPSLFTKNCWGGYTYNSLGLQFTSPTINMFESGDDYLRLMSNLPYYLNQPVELERFEWEPNLKREYPIGRIDDVLFHFNHYKTFEDAVNKWEERKARVNKKNIIAVSFTEDPTFAEKFDQLPLDKKICFAPFEADFNSLAYVEIPENLSHLAFYQIVNKMGMGDFEYYDVFELLAYGQFKRL